MQVANEGNWTERSLSYLCRSFDNLTKGQDYKEVLPVIHISFLDYTLFLDNPEFYAVYQMANNRSHHIFSDKFQLRVVELNQISLASEEDKAYGLDYWAKLFKARTWKELKAVSDKNEYLEETAKTIHTLSSDEMTREICRRRDDYNKELNYYKTTIKEQAARIAELEALLASK